jgi:hypothetical protein
VNSIFMVLGARLMRHAHLQQQHITLSLHSRLVTLCTDERHDNKIDTQKMMLILSGCLTECLLEYDDPFEERDRFLRSASTNVEEGVSVGAQTQSPPHIGAMDLDRYIELGRALARFYLDDDEESPLILRLSLLDIMDIIIKQNALNAQALIVCFKDFAWAALHFEIVTHLFCDRVIDSKIAEEEWTISDAIMAMSGLAGRYYAFAALKEEDDTAYQAANGVAGVAPQSFIENMRHVDHVLHVMMNEAMRMGVPEATGTFYGMAANDVEYPTCTHLIYGLEPVFGLLASAHNMDCYALRCVVVAKAAGRMIAVAASGMSPEVEHIVARPLALASFIGNYQYFMPQTA